MAIIALNISLLGDGFPASDELDLRWTLEDMIEENQVGEVVGAGSGMGAMDVSVEVDDIESALGAINEILVQLHIEDITSISVTET